MLKALFAGSFDPVHLGHIDIIRRASACFDEVVVAVTVNLAKRNMFSVDERLEMLEEVCRDLPNVTIDRIDGLRSEYIGRNGINVDLRSIRNETDLDYEMPVQQMFAEMGFGAETLVMFTPPRLSYISSNQIRQVYSLGGDVSAMVDARTLAYMDKKLSQTTRL
ncbi:MAG TPA: pantetheine-phosphate adenylyltransferase [Bacillota bacterium]|nr:pantetheine-phosphate adenylyltransferase [Bacillota bacterium]HQC36163.1 pantetheine-phosphate adenylyltransferase [Bacillota bacterium]